VSDQFHIRVGEDIALALAAVVKCDFLCLASYATHAGAVFAFEACFYGGEAAKGGGDGAKDGDGQVVVEEEQEGPAYAEGSRELGGEENEVEGGFEDVATREKETRSGNAFGRVFTKQRKKKNVL